MSGGDLTVNFKVDTSWLQLPRRGTPPYREGEPGKVYARKELNRFVHIDKISDEQNAYATEGGSTRDYVLDVISKVIAVILPTLSVLMPLAVCYLPPWAPFGIGLPVILILSIVQSQIKSKIEIYKREQTFIPLFSDFLQHPTFKTLQPMGQEDLPVQDERLKSDEMMHEEVEERRPLLKRPEKPDSRFDLDVPSYRYRTVATIANRYDVEISPYLQQAVAAEYAGMPHKQEKWIGVFNLQEDILAAAREGDFKAFSKKIAKREELSCESNCPAVDYPPLTLRSYVKSLAELYNRFYLKIKSLDHLHKEGEALYSVSAEGWQQYLELAGTAKAQLEKCKEDADRLDEILFAPDYALELIFYRLNAETRRIEEQLQKWIAAHPTKRHRAIQTRLDHYVIQVMFTENEFKRFTAWVNEHPHEANQKIVKLGQKFPIEFKAWMDKHPQLHFETARDLLERVGLIRKSFPHPIQEVLTAQQLGVVFVNWVEQHPDLIDQTILDLAGRFPKELKGWIEQHPQMRFETARDVFSRSVKVFELFQAAERAYKGLKKESHAIDAFEETIMAPLAAEISGQNGAVEFKQKFRAAVTKLPAIPFAKEVIPEKTSPLKSRKIEEISLNKLLRDVDSQMIFTNRARKYGLRIPLVALFAIEAIVAFYLSTPWIYWGLGALAALGEGVSYYVDKKLQEMERKKQAIKLQYILRDHPEIGVVPGTKSHLKPVKQAQQKYGLDGVGATWARILTEDTGTPVESAQNLLAAAEATRTLAKEGSEVAATYLEAALLNLYSQRSVLQAIGKKDRAHSAQLRNLTKRIENIEKVMYSAEEAPEPKNPTPKQLLAKKLREAAEKQRQEAQKAHRQRHQLEKELDVLTKRTLYETNQMAIVNFKQFHFDAIAQILPSNFLERSLSQEEKQKYLDSIDLSLKQRHTSVLQVLSSLQIEKLPLAAALEAKLKEKAIDQVYFDELVKMLPVLSERRHTKEEVQEYLLRIDKSLKQRHAQALQNLSSFQTDEEVPTPSTLKVKREAIQANLTAIQNRRSELLHAYHDSKIKEIQTVIADVNSEHDKMSKKLSRHQKTDLQKEQERNRLKKEQERNLLQKELERNRAHHDNLLKALEEYKSGVRKSCYVPLARERQLVGEALDTLAEKEIYMETKRKEFRRVSRQFAILENLFTSEPVLQAEIDLLLETLKMVPLPPDPEKPIVSDELLRNIKKKLGSFPFNLLSNDIKFLAFKEEIDQLRMLPPEQRLGLAQLLRKLQNLQNDKDYQSNNTVDTNAALAKENLKGIREEMVLLKKKYNELSIETSRKS